MQLDGTAVGVGTNLLLRKHRRQAPPPASDAAGAHVLHTSCKGILVKPNEAECPEANRSRPDSVHSVRAVLA